MRQSGLLAGLLAGFALLTAPSVQAKAVDLALVLAIDVSGSVNEERFQLQRAGYAAAFAAPDVLDAIVAGQNRQIAVTLVEWSGSRSETEMIGWTLISDAASSESFSSAIAETPRVFSDATSISGAIDYSVSVLNQCPFEARRQVIDVSGDGSNNDGRSVEAARDEALAAGITINGLPILTEETALDIYYRDHVIGGPNAFVAPVHDFSAFARAIQEKLIREIVHVPVSPRVKLASLPVP